MFINSKNYNKTIAVLLTTCNSEKFLKDQIDSILQQNKVIVHFYISDDNSTDGTLKILNYYFKNYPYNFKKLLKVNFRNCDKNFLNLVLHVPKYKYYALSDHDDIWLKDKLFRSISKLEQGYSAYGCRLKSVDENLKFKGQLSPLWRHKLCFKNAIVQGIVGNAVLVFKDDIMQILRSNKPNFYTDVSWLIYLITTYHGKFFFYDKRPMTLYRQHSGNNHGIKTGFYSRIKRIFYDFFFKTYKKFNNKHINYLRKFKINIPPENILTLEKFDYMRKNLNYFKFNLKYFNNVGVYRQTFAGNFLLKLFIIFNAE
jgi:glycosyltransferase involved in cell wall biosynthesis